MSKQTVSANGGTVPAKGQQPQAPDATADRASKLIDVADGLIQVDALMDAAFIIGEGAEPAVRDPLHAVLFALEEKLDAARATLEIARRQPEEMANG